MVKSLYWFLITCVFAALIYVFETELDLFSILVENDSTYICYLVAGVFVTGVLTAGVEAYMGKSLCKTNQLADFSTKLGLLGTIIGMATSFYMISKSNFDFTQSENVTKVSMHIFSGMGSAFTTTVAGLISSLFLSIYVMILGRCNDDN